MEAIGVDRGINGTGWQARGVPGILGTETWQGIGCDNPLAGKAPPLAGESERRQVKEETWLLLTETASPMPAQAGLVAGRAAAPPARRDGPITVCGTPSPCTCRRVSPQANIHPRSGGITATTSIVGRLAKTKPGPVSINMTSYKEPET